MTAVSYSTRVQLDPAEVAQVWSFYRRTFAPLAKLAVNRHVLHESEFAEIAADPLIEKHTAHDDAGRVVGLATITNHLSHWPLVSPDWFAHHHPELYRRGQVWYVGFVGARANHLNVFTGLLESMTAGRRNTDVFYMDFCKVNVDRGIIALCERRLSEFDSRVRMTEVDSQSFWLTTFGSEG